MDYLSSQYKNFASGLNARVVMIRCDAEENYLASIKAVNARLDAIGTRFTELEATYETPLCGGSEHG